MPGPLAGKVALVTGARARHRPRERAQARVGGLRRRRQLLQQPRRSRGALRRVARRSAGAPSRSRAASAMPDSVEEMFAAFAQALRPRSTSSCRNAASGVLKPAMEMKLKHWRWCLETNAFALNLLAQHAVPLMQRRRAHRRDVEPRRAARDAELRLRRRVEGGAGSAGAHARAGARAARHSRQRGVRRRGRHRRARVLSRTASSCSPSSRQRTPAGPTLTPEDVANAVYLLCLPEAAMINGATLVVDGGFAISG